MSHFPDPIHPEAVCPKCDMWIWWKQVDRSVVCYCPTCHAEGRGETSITALSAFAQKHNTTAFEITVEEPHV